MTGMDIEQMIKAQNEKRRQNVRLFVSSARHGDLEPMFDALTALYDDHEGLRCAFREIVTVEVVPDEVREAFLNVWVERDGIRDDVKDDYLLLDALRQLLPKYRGPDMRLYRGESTQAHEDRTYGWSWTSSREVAHSFATHNQCHPLGAVVLRADVPAEAIFSAPALFEHLKQEEEEYCVDRRVLAERGVQIEVVETLSHIPTDE